MRHSPVTRPALLLLASCLPLAATAAESSGLQWLNNTQVQALLLWPVIILQSLILYGMYLSRERQKLKKEHLKTAQKSLEQRVVERTNRLRTINNQLYEEIARHEITEELLRETQDYLNSILNSMPSVLIGVTRQGNITHWNTAAAQVTGVSPKDALGRPLFEVYGDIPVSNDMVTEAIDSGVPQTQENIQLGSGSHAQHCDVTIYPLLSAEITGAVIRIDDVTMRVRIENMMIQNEKMMSLGELAAGIAHEINNPLSAIVHGVQNIYRRTSEDLPRNRTTAEELGISVKDVERYLEARGIYSFLEAIREAGDRSARIVTNMLEFSRSNHRSHQLTDVADLVEHSLELAKNSFDLKTADGSQTLKIVRDYDPQAPKVRCSAAEMQQVILNLLRNASQAFTAPASEQQAAPTLTLRTRAVPGAVRIEIGDNGPGMPDSVKRHIFEPFFTTKEVGQGTGLGLSVTYFIVTEHHDGTIEVESEPGRGTRFVITLPCA
ncbi:nitrogen regulation protein NR(II) [Pseudomaricurvus sp. HS19]|uniref:two-component system sensor histidine kinase NtrB n=1 Tax=Pseudomaricurvus sp. HS19 TaxID=2692626 RepID=UPI001367BC21|nr:ATP-binding protein [Pseudomaricurvus sp. HS19]MYM62250.1 PAS domain-containing protein [Pseudomaricurvus sp. HS19]